MTDNTPLVTVKILDRNYRIKCSPEEAPKLRSAASYVDAQMRKLRQHGKVNNTDSIAVVVALNTANELMSVKQQHANEHAETTEHVLKITQLIDQSLAKEAPIEV